MQGKLLTFAYLSSSCGWWKAGRPPEVCLISYVLCVSRFQNMYILSLLRDLFVKFMSILCPLHYEGAIHKGCKRQEGEGQENPTTLIKMTSFPIKSPDKGERAQTVPKNPDILHWWSKLKLMPRNSYFSA